jgi:hypothetical protein
MWTVADRRCIAAAILTSSNVDAVRTDRMTPARSPFRAIDQGESCRSERRPKGYGSGSSQGTEPKQTMPFPCGKAWCVRTV